MCGISGAIGYGQDVCLKMLDHQKKRGPDFTGWTLKEGVFLGHNRLSIIDLSENGNQPMSAGRYALVYNGEIYNYREMQGYLFPDDDSGHHTCGNDAWTLLHYIAKFGIEEALKDANGMYAFAALDSQQQKIHLVVDRFGQKPLYYYHSGEKFAFASSVGALLTLNDKWKIEEEGLQSYWLLGAPMGENTMISGIKKLTGSHHLTYDIRENTVKIERYWTPTFQKNTSGIEDLILDAINKVKVADVRPYVFLSGGIDSTLVASQYSGGCAVHLNGPELRYASEAARKFKMDMAVVDPQAINIEESLKDYAFQVGEPSMAALIPYVTAKEVGKFAKVAISANGADELFCGYDRIKDKPGSDQMRHIFRGCFLDDEWSQLDKIPRFPYDDRVPQGRISELEYYVQFDLNRTLDGAAMCHSLEVRNPFLDHRLVEMALSIPYEKHIDLVLGRKAILKRMLEKMGFSKEFLTRPKLGFSLHKEPREMEVLKQRAWQFVKQHGFLKCTDRELGGRDKRYLEMSALSFWYWHQTWYEKIH